MTDTTGNTNMTDTTDNTNMTDTTGNTNDLDSIIYLDRMANILIKNGYNIASLEEGYSNLSGNISLIKTRIENIVNDNKLLDSINTQGATSIIDLLNNINKKFEKFAGYVGYDIANKKFFVEDTLQKSAPTANARQFTSPNGEVKILDDQSVSYKFSSDIVYNPIPYIGGNLFISNSGDYYFTDDPNEIYHVFSGASSTEYIDLTKDDYTRYSSTITDDVYYISGGVNSNPDSLKILPDTFYGKTIEAELIARKGLSMSRENSIYAEALDGAIVANKNAINSMKDANNPYSLQGQIIGNTNAIAFMQDGNKSGSLKSQINANTDAIYSMQDGTNPYGLQGQINSMKDGTNPSSLQGQISSMQDGNNPSSFKSQITANTDAIYSMQDGTNPYGLQGQITANTNAINSMQDGTNPSSLKSQITANTNAINSMKNPNDASSLQGQITANTNAIAFMQDGTKSGSLQNQISTINSKVTIIDNRIGLNTYTETVNTTVSVDLSNWNLNDYAKINDNNYLVLNSSGTFVIQQSAGNGTLRTLNVDPGCRYIILFNGTSNAERLFKASDGTVVMSLGTSYTFTLNGLRRDVNKIFAMQAGGVSSAWDRSHRILSQEDNSQSTKDSRTTEKSDIEDKQNTQANKGFLAQTIDN